jgi:hypothetical protein
MRDRHAHPPPICVPVPSTSEARMKRRSWNALVSFTVAALALASAVVGVADVLMLLKS